jgi:hypothetical protein
MSLLCVVFGCLVACRVDIADLLGAAFAGDANVASILDLVNQYGIAFENVSLAYDNSTSPKWSVSGFPDMSRVPGVSTVLNALRFAPRDIMLRTLPTGVAFGIQKEYPLDLPSPFTGPSQSLLFDLGVDTTSKAFLLRSRFVATLSLPGTSSPVGLNVTASLSSATGSGTSLDLSGRTISPIAFSGMNFIRVSSLSLDASVSLSPSVSVRNLALLGSVVVSKSTGDGRFVYNTTSRDVRFFVGFDR